MSTYGSSSGTLERIEGGYSCPRSLDFSKGSFPNYLHQASCTWNFKSQVQAVVKLVIHFFRVNDDVGYDDAASHDHVLESNR